jgi:hypothetical protein
MYQNDVSKIPDLEPKMAEIVRFLMCPLSEIQDQPHPLQNTVGVTVILK